MLSVSWNGTRQPTRLSAVVAYTNDSTAGIHDIWLLEGIKACRMTVEIEIKQLRIINPRFTLSSV